MSDVIYSPSVSYQGQNGSRGGSGSIDMQSASDVGYVSNNQSSNNVNRDYNNNLSIALNEMNYNRNRNTARDADFRNENLWRDLLDYNYRNFQTALDYDREMSNTQYTRAMEDLKNAGINPILAGRIGGATYHGAGNFATSSFIPNSNTYYNSSPQLDYNDYNRDEISFLDVILNYMLGQDKLQNAIDLANLNFDFNKTLKDLDYEYDNSLMKSKYIFDDSLQRMSFERNAGLQKELLTDKNIANILGALISMFKFSSFNYQ